MSGADVTCYIKPGDLASWLAVRSVQALAMDLQLTVDWQPVVETVRNLADSNLKPGEDDPLAAYKARRAAARQNAAKRERERQCEILQIPVENTLREVDPLVISLGMLWVAADSADKVPEYLESACRYLYLDEGNDADVSTVATLIKGADVSAEGFEQHVESHRESLLAEQATLFENGILGAPTIVVDDQIFLGREHLPQIRWILTGKDGPPPV